MSIRSTLALAVASSLVLIVAHLEFSFTALGAGFIGLALVALACAAVAGVVPACHDDGARQTRNDEHGGGAEELHALHDGLPRDCRRPATLEGTNRGGIVQSPAAPRYT